MTYCNDCKDALSTFAPSTWAGGNKKNTVELHCKEYTEKKKKCDMCGESVLKDTDNLNKNYYVKIIDEHSKLPKELQEEFKDFLMLNSDYIQGEVLLTYYKEKLLFYIYSETLTAGYLENISFSGALDWIPKRMEEAYKLGWKDAKNYK